MGHERLAMLISGGGTTMQEIIRACQSGEVPMAIAGVVASTIHAGGIEKARNLGIPVIVVDPNEFRTNPDGPVDHNKFGLKLLRVLRERGASVVTQNGWLPLTPEAVIEEYSGKIFNQHPGPVPEFGGRGMFGRRVHAARLMFARMVKRDFWTEAIAQRVHKEYDRGLVVKSEEVPILSSDTVEDLQQRVLLAEHRVQIRLLQDVAAGKLKFVPQRESLVGTKEASMLGSAKRMARFLYPNG